MIDILEQVKPKKLSKKQRFMEFLIEMEQLMAVNPLRELPIGHDFTDKMYIRSLFIPAGAFLTSRVHLTQHPYEVSMGKIVIGTKDGLTNIDAPYRGVTEKNTIRCGFAVEDTIWTTYHYNEDNCRDLETIEKRIFKDYIINRT
jgi:hypothetical protein